MAYFCATLTIGFPVVFQILSVCWCLLFLALVSVLLFVVFSYFHIELFLVRECPFDITPILRFVPECSLLFVVIGGGGDVCFSCIFHSSYKEFSICMFWVFSPRRFQSCRHGSGLRMSNLSTCLFCSFSDVWYFGMFRIVLGCLDILYLSRRIIFWIGQLFELSSVSSSS